MKQNVHKHQAINIKSVCKKLIPLVFTTLFYQGVNAQSVPCNSLSVNSVSICYGATATLTASGVSSYSWSTGSQYDTTIVKPNTSTIYTLTGSTPSLGCESTVTVEVAVSYIPFLSVTVSSTDVCIGNEATLTVSGANSYTWTSSIGWYIGNGSSIMVTPTITTTFVISAELGNCINVDSVFVEVHELPVINTAASSTTVCGGDFVTFTAEGVNTYTWSNGTHSSSFLVIVPYSYIPTIVTYSVLGTDEYGCVSYSQVSVTVNNCLGMTNITNNTNLNIYPNPASEILNVECETANENLFVSIIDIYGREIRNEKLEIKSGVAEINVKGLSKGIYVLRLSNQNREVLYQQKLVKE